MNRKLLEDLRTTGYTPEIVKHEAISMIEGQEKEITRLNDIINELEDELENAINEDYEYNDYNRGVNNTINHILNRLKDLKENK